MRELICQKFCCFFNPRKDEAEKCLAFELLAAWSQWEPGLTPALAAGISCSPYPSRGKGNEAIINNVSAQLVSPTPGLPIIAEIICARCAFRSHGCDFAAQVPESPPCGGLLALDHLSAQGVIGPEALIRARERFLETCYLRLAEHVCLRALETPHLYDRLGDELYEVNEEGFAWLSRCDGTTPGLATAADREFLEFLLAESLLACGAVPSPRLLSWRPSPLPSLRYLELMLTERCNLRCRHCYLGDTGEQELPLPQVLEALTEFQAMQGLRVLLSGGEPLLHSRWRQLNERLPDFELRLVLLSNGLLLTDAVLRELQVHEVQISLDGLEAGHERIRGRGTWAKTVARLKAVQDVGLGISVATMIHPDNLAELDEMGAWLRELGVREWSLDIPCVGGRMAQHPELYVDPVAGARYLELGFGGSDHGGADGFACGRHLGAVLPNGTVAKCSLFGDRPLGRLAEGLERCWLRLVHVPLNELDCAPCPHVNECRGGCRFRAGGGLGPDPVMCARYGIDPKILKEINNA